MTQAAEQQEKQAAYDAWFVAEVDKGLADLAAGKVLSDEEATLAMEHFFGALAQETSQAA